MHFDEYRRNDAVSLAELVKTGDVSALELLDAAIVRADAVNPKLNLMTVRMEEAARERTSGELRGPFAGVPFLLKDLGQDYKGLRTLSGSNSTRNHIAAEHGTIVQRWLDAGLVIFGKTTTPEFGARPITESEATGPTRNPYDLNRTPGGSSGGAAAAVAAGVVPAAGASDGGGSIRIPAGYCGLVGLKAGRGVIPAGPEHAESFFGGATDGVVSRTVRDSAAMLDVMTAGNDPTAPYLAAKPTESFAELARRVPRKLRIGFSAQSPIGTVVDAEAVAAVDSAVKLLQNLGHEVEQAEPKINGEEMAKDFLTMWAAESALRVEYTKTELDASDKDFELETRLLVAAAHRISAPDVLAAWKKWHTYTRQLAEFHAHYDLFLTPTSARPAIRIGETDMPRESQALAKSLLRLGVAGRLQGTAIWDKAVIDNLQHVPFTQLANVTGRPAISLPLHVTSGGLPLGVQFVGPLGSEALLLSLATQLEDAQPWAHLAPQL